MMVKNNVELNTIARKEVIKEFNNTTYLDNVIYY